MAHLLERDHKPHRKSANIDYRRLPTHDTTTIDEKPYDSNFIY